MADQDFIERTKKQYGEGSVYYTIHILGKFAEDETSAIFQAALLYSSQQAWAETKVSGMLVLGVDPAGAGTDGDETAIAIRRGAKVINVLTFRGMTPEGILVQCVSLIGQHRGESWEMPAIVLDRDGSEGAKVYTTMLGYLETHKDAFRLVGIRGSEAAKRRPQDYNHVRDEMWFNLLNRMFEGLAIPPNAKLEKDLRSIKFDKLVNGKTTVIKKQAIRKELGRSPDMADALCLCAYESPTWEYLEQERGTQQLQEVDNYRRPMGELGAAAIADPYAMLELAQRGFRR